MTLFNPRLYGGDVTDNEIMQKFLAVRYGEPASWCGGVPVEGRTTCTVPAVPDCRLQDGSASLSAKSLPASYATEVRLCQDVLPYHLE